MLLPNAPCLMRETRSLVWFALVGLFRSRASLEAEILVLRHQLNVQRRQSPKKLAFSIIDRLIFAGLYRLAPSVLNVLTIVKPETVIKWHRAGFRSYWRWKSRPHGDRPTSPCSPWQNGYAERLIGLIRRECVDHIIVWGKRHLQHALLSYMKYYNEVRTHLSLEKDAPVPRAVGTFDHVLWPSRPGRTAPLICPDLISDRHRPRFSNLNPAKAPGFGAFATASETLGTERNAWWRTQSSANPSPCQIPC
jgi:hypothetical protein